MGYSGAGGKLIHEKSRSKKSRNTVPLSSLLLCISLVAPHVLHLNGNLFIDKPRRPLPPSPPACPPTVFNLLCLRAVLWLDNNRVGMKTLLSCPHIFLTSAPTFCNPQFKDFFGWTFFVTFVKYVEKMLKNKISQKISQILSKSFQISTKIKTATMSAKMPDWNFVKLWQHAWEEGLMVKNSLFCQLLVLYNTRQRLPRKPKPQAYLFFKKKNRAGTVSNQINSLNMMPN